MTGLVVGRQLLLVLVHHHGLALGAHHDLVLGALELLHGHRATVGACGEERGLVDQVRQVRARETGRAARDDRGANVLGERKLPHVDLEDLLAAADIRQRYDDLPVEPAGPKQCRVEHVGPVGCRDYDHALVALEAVHLDQELVQRLLALVVTAPRPRRDPIRPRRSRR